MKELYWFDPKIYTSTSDNPFTTGVSVTMTEPVDGLILSDVIEELRSRFPYFYIRVKLGESDLVLEQNPLPVIVRNSWDPIKLYSKEANYHFITFKYLGNRITFELAHILSDAAGFLPYFKSVLYCYLTRKTGEKPDPTGFHLPGEEIPESETGNPFSNIDIDSVELPQTSLSNDFYNLNEKMPREKEWKSFYLQLPEQEFINYCKSNGGSPNILLSALIAKAIRNLDPNSNKTITASVAIDCKSILGVPNNYRAFPFFALLDFPKNQEQEEISKVLMRGREQLKTQTAPERVKQILKGQKILFDQLKHLPIKTKFDLNQKVCNAKLATFAVSYANNRSFGPLDKYIKEVYILAEPNVIDVMCEVGCINQSFFLAFFQNFSSEALFEAFLKELEKIGIPYEIKRKEPYRTCGAQYDGIEI